MGTCPWDKHEKHKYWQWISDFLIRTSIFFSWTSLVLKGLFLGQAKKILNVKACLISSSLIVMFCSTDSLLSCSASSLVSARSVSSVCSERSYMSCSSLISRSLAADSASTFRLVSEVRMLPVEIRPWLNHGNSRPLMVPAPP